MSGVLQSLVCCKPFCSEVHSRLIEWSEEYYCSMCRIGMTEVLLSNLLTKIIQITIIDLDSNSFI